MITKEQIVTWLERSADILEEKKLYLTELDSPIGDGDHGINMARGFDNLIKKLPAVADTDIGNILKSSGMALISGVGGASGPLYGTFFMRAGDSVQSKQELDGDDLVNLLNAGLKGIQERGRAEPGEKTMLDSLFPAVNALRDSMEKGDSLQDALAACVQAAEQGMKDTIPLVATKGRASYLGERSVGHQDPGATSTYLLLKTLVDTVNELRD